MTIEGPYDAKGATDTASREPIFTCRPGARRVRKTRCARRIVSTLAKRAFRRPVTAADMNVLMQFYQSGPRRGRHLRRRHRGGAAAHPRRSASSSTAASASRRLSRSASRIAISDLELASRLSFFLWSSIPDDQLIDVAAPGTLREPAVLEQQVRRMLADPRSDALIANFTGQWLERPLAEDARAGRQPVPRLRRQPARRLSSARSSCSSPASSRRIAASSICSTADYTFVNERLAKHYGIPNIYGPQFRRVTLPAALDMRRGLLGKGALLTVTSNAARTSPVMRGKWFLATFLGVEPPQPPPGVEATSEARPPTRRATRSRRRCGRALEEHRVNPTCASCHQIFEPMGIALENFDAVGAWRTLDEGSPVDASGVLPDGTKLDGVGQPARRRWCATRDQFARVVAEKLLTYALGRGVEHDDMPLVRSHRARRRRPASYRFSSLVLGIVKSPAFQMNMKPAAARTEQQRAARVSGDATEVMFLTKKHISRRTVLRGAGATLALPLLDAMVPAAHGAGADRGRAEAAVRRPVRAARRGAGLLGAGDGGRAARRAAVQLEAARAVPRPDA